MIKSKIINIFNGDFSPKESKAFSYKINEKNSRIVGILHNDKSEISISFFNESELEINCLENIVVDSLSIPPSKRILTWKQSLSDCSVIRGKIKNLTTQNKTISLYLIIEK